MKKNHNVPPPTADLGRELLEYRHEHRARFLAVRASREEAYRLRAQKQTERQAEREARRAAGELNALDVALSERPSSLLTLLGAALRASLAAGAVGACLLCLGAPDFTLMKDAAFLCAIVVLGAGLLLELTSYGAVFTTRENSSKAHKVLHAIALALALLVATLLDGHISWPRLVLSSLAVFIVAEAAGRLLASSVEGRQELFAHRHKLHARQARGSGDAALYRQHHQNHKTVDGPHSVQLAEDVGVRLRKKDEGAP